VEGYAAKGARLSRRCRQSYARIGLDGEGRAGIEWGVYGVPETYIIDGHGVIRERFVGPITPDSLVLDILPAIAAAARN